MECHEAYAVALDEKGSFLNIANMNYKTGQIVSNVVAYREETHTKTYALKWMVMAACLCLFLLGSWYSSYVSYGVIRMQINPDVEITVNRQRHVTSIKAINSDGENLINNYHYKGKKIEVVLDELADRAILMGYLHENGIIHISVSSHHKSWKKQISDDITRELENHFNGTIKITTDKDKPDTTKEQNSESEQSTTSVANTAEYKERYEEQSTTENVDTGENEHINDNDIIDDDNDDNNDDESDDSDDTDDDNDTQVNEEEDDDSDDVMEEDDEEYSNENDAEEDD
ncbi:MAG: hypothetical protein ACI4F4_04780 [Lachnospiraceae bacterium]